MPRIVALCLVTLALASPTRAQDPPRFTVVSIKPSPDNEPGSRVEPRARGDYTVRKMTLSGLLSGAYGIPVNRIEGAPAWWKTDRFDIDARYDSADPTAAIPPLPVLQQSILRERFGLVAHIEQRAVPVYALRIAAPDGHLGPGLRRSTIECAGVGQPANAADTNRQAGNGAPVCGANENPEAFIGSGLPLDVLAQALRPAAGRDVLNETGLTGRWDITLQFSPLGVPTSDTPDLMTAVRDQLGLKLDAQMAPMDVLVIDHIERPTEN